MTRRVYEMLAALPLVVAVGCSSATTPSPGSSSNDGAGGGKTSSASPDGSGTGDDGSPINHPSDSAAIALTTQSGEIWNGLMTVTIVPPADYGDAALNNGFAYLFVGAYTPDRTRGLGLTVNVPIQNLLTGELEFPFSEFGNATSTSIGVSLTEHPFSPPPEIHPIFEASARARLSIEGNSVSGLVQMNAFPGSSTFAGAIQVSCQYAVELGGVNGSPSSESPGVGPVLADDPSFSSPFCSQFRTLAGR